MKWILLALVLVVAVVACTVAVRALRPGLFRGATRVRCLRCRGTGWLGGETERTLDFTGDGFADRHTPATPCPECSGVGFRLR